MWDRLGEPVDLLVVGGGINGAGIARDAARRGLSVAMVEMRDLAWGTSSRSSKLVHGGLRYLEQFEFGLVFESVSERRILLDIAPHIVNPLGFLFPVYKNSRKPLTLINAGMWIYEGLSLFRSPKRHRTVKPAEMETLEPALNREGLKGAPLYFDCSTDDARLTLESALDAVEHGATVTTWAKVTGFIKDEETGRVKGAVIKDMLTGSEKHVEAPVIINATGPWTDRTVSMSRELPQAMLRPTKGTHVVVEHKKLPVNHAVVVFHPEDGRVLFAIPWGDRTYLGTTDTDELEDPALISASAEDVRYLLTAAKHQFPDFPLTPDDIISTWSGLRPLMRPQSRKGEAIDESSISREHQIVIGQDGLITIAGGKLTTYRRMSAEVVDTAVKVLRAVRGEKPSLQAAETDTAPLPGAVGWPEDDDAQKVIQQVLEESGGHLSEASAALLANTYGMRAIEIAAMISDAPALAQPIVPGRPEVMAQVTWAVRRELAAQVSDVMIRRTQLFFRDLNQGLDAADAVADHMAAMLGWDDERREASLADYHHEVALSRRWREEMTIKVAEEEAAEAAEVAVNVEQPVTAT